MTIQFDGIKFWDDKEIKETTFDRSIVGKLSRRIHLPPELKEATHEERFICDQEMVSNWELGHNYQTGWTKVWMPSRWVIKQAEKVEVIRRQHQKAGKFIIFRIWKDGQE